MNDTCISFPTEYQHEYYAKKINKLEPIRPIEDYETKITDGSEYISEKAEALVRKLILDRYKTYNQVHFDKEILERYARAKEEKDLGSELVNYIRNLYSVHTEEVKRVPYTTTRIFGYVSPQTLHCELSTYQDVHGRSGGKVILQNLQRVKAAKQRQSKLRKLEANLGYSPTDANSDQCKF